ncbi:MAG TPA: MFS transporter [Candidatus Paceibacterota bacterium]|nr:MFS transporter [Verrucomicrobiota bacterium]HRY46811.1 MFS transporter [Candidatus Paceibacterota bacterium]HSA00504.1 MFS transporter [Candidatus Paceibacterota bacterium]
MISSTNPKDASSPGPRLRDITSGQWKSGTAAWLGWLFDGLDMHLYTLVAAPFVAQLLQVSSPADPMVKRTSAWIQAAFLLGWALGGGFFGRIGDRFGRSWALSLTILTYALFTGLSCFAQTWWHLLIFRFLAALGIGGEWAVGASLLSETWPKSWRPWIAAVLQTGVNLGILLACLAVFLMADANPRYVFLVGILPALIVFWIRRSVPEPTEWQEARARDPKSSPGWTELFRGPVRSLTLRAVLLCALSLTAWWAFLFWNQQHLRNLPALASWIPADRERLVSAVFFLVIASSIAGNFFAGWLALRAGYRRAISLLFACFFLSMAGAYWVPRDHTQLLWWMPWVGFFSGVFGLFTMYLPPLFPTLLRTTGAGFSFNIGRVAAAFGTVFFGIFAQVGDFRPALFLASFLLAAAAGAALLMPEAPQTRDVIS